LQNELVLSERDYFKEPLGEDEVREMAAIAGIDQIFAKRSPSLKQMGLAGQQLSEDEMVRLMLQEPKLVRRPMMRVGDQLFVGGGASVLDSVVAASA
jgi:arsenate reductase-like glutaredoxin family protein